MERDNSARLDLDSDAQLLGGTAEMLLLACVIASCNELQLSCEQQIGFRDSDLIASLI